MPQPKASVEVNISNLSLPLPIMMLGSTGDYERYLNSITPSGQDTPPGIEFTTVRSRFGRRMLSLAGDLGGELPTPEEELIARMVRSLHASFRDESPKGSPLEHLFPHTGDSLRQMSEVRRLAGRPLRAVLYTRQFDQPADYRNKAGLFRARSFQPKPRDFTELWHLGLTPATESVIERMREHGLDDVTPDTTHSISLSETISNLSAAGLVKAVHVSVGRKDLPPGLAALSMQAKDAFIRSPEAAASTVEGDMLLGIFRHWRDHGGNYLATLETSADWNIRRARYEQQAMLENTHELMRMAGL